MNTRSGMLLLVLLVIIASVAIRGEEPPHKKEEDSSTHEHYDKEGKHDDEFDHEAVIGSHKTAEEYQELTPEESQKRLGVIITRMDKNGDDCVDREELTQWMINNFLNLDVENAAMRMDEADKDKDGKVSLEEYLKSSYGSGEKEIKEMEKDKAPDMIAFVNMVAEEKLKFETADVDKNGYLDTKEYVAFVFPQNYDHMAPYEINRTLSDFDKNKDGFVDKKEFVFEAHFMDNVTKAEEMVHFKEYDKNGDEKLDREELILWVMPGHKATANSEADHLFSETDANKDGKLCRDEILKQYQLWVGSHATEYGKQIDDLKKEEL